MNFDLLLALVFYILLYVYFKRHRNKFQLQGKVVALYKTQLGLKAMESIAKRYPRVLHCLAFLSVVTGFVGMAWIFYFLIKGTLDMLIVQGALPAVAPILPGIQVIPGLPVMSFWHWILAILVVATVHEFTHGVFGRLYNTRIKSSGFVIFGPILGAFVEPDEKQLKKKPKYQQIAIFSGGPFSNILTTLLFGVLLVFVLNPINGAIQTGDGIIVNTLMEEYPAKNLSVTTPFTVVAINDQPTLDIESFVAAMKGVSPGESIVLNTDQGDHALVTVANPQNASLAFLGIGGLELKQVIRQDVRERFGTPLIKTFMWFHLFMFWLVVVSLGIGLFNLLPLGPLDGGRMFLTAATIFWKEDKAKKVWGFISYFCLLLIFINLAPYLWKFLVFLAKPLLMLAT